MVTLDDVLAKVSYRRRDALKRILTPKRDEVVMQGLRDRRWSTMEQARRELRVSRSSMQAIRSVLKLANLMPWSGDWESFSLGVPERYVQRPLFVATKDGYKYSN